MDKKLRRLVTVGISSLSLALIPLESFADSLTMTTWYPAPYGVYTNLRSTRDAYFAYQSGNVGIGTTSPLAKLHVNGLLKLQDPLSSGLLTIDPADNSFQTSAGDLILQHPSNNNNVRIGTTGPWDGAKLTIYSPYGYPLRLSSNSTYTNYISFYNDDLPWGLTGPNNSQASIGWSERDGGMGWAYGSGWQPISTAQSFNIVALGHYTQNLGTINFVTFHNNNFFSTLRVMPGGVQVTTPMVQTTNGLCHASRPDPNPGAWPVQLDTIVYCNGTPSDIAEWYDTASDVDLGSIVIASSSTMNIEYASGLGKATDSNGNKFEEVPLPGPIRGLSILRKSEKPYDPKILGVVSRAPYQTFGEDALKTAKHPQRIALAGRVPVKVCNESGWIKPGDRITSSSSPGVGMKAVRSGMTIGIALEEFKGSLPATQAQTGEILVFVNPSYWKTEEPRISDAGKAEPVLRSPNGACWKLLVSDSGAIQSTPSACPQNQKTIEEIKEPSGGMR